VPRELGGQGFTFAECMREQRRLGDDAHATALAMNMHLYWVGVAADLWRAGDRSLEWMLRGAISGEALSHEIVAKLTLGIDPDAQPRWG
jgi:hypothetical protein